MTGPRRGLRRAAGSLALACLLALAASPAGAAAPTDDLRSALERAIRVLQDPALKSEARAAERRQQLRRVADEIFDFGEIARRALAQHWRPLTEAEQREFVALFADLLERSYMSRIEQYSGEPVRYVSEQVEGELASVATRLLTKQGAEVPIDYRMRRRDGRWWIYDVSVEGVSLVSNYRTQFNAVIRSSSFAELVRRLQARVEELHGTR